METIGLPKEIENLKGFEIEDNKGLGNEHTYWDLPIRKKRGIVRKCGYGSSKNTMDR